MWEASDSLQIELDEQTPITGDRIFSKLLALAYKKGSPLQIPWLMETSPGLGKAEKHANVTALQSTHRSSRAIPDASRASARSPARNG